ncbi:hypothetical protein Dimus_036975, partial [Dionaea muscipula]
MAVDSGGCSPLAGGGVAKMVMCGQQTSGFSPWRRGQPADGAEAGSGDGLWVKLGDGRRTGQACWWLAVFLG